jgi:uncharacterized protein (TIGR03086 family)
MSTQPLATSIDLASAALRAVEPAQLDATTPCSSWTVRDLVNHMVGAQYWFLSGVEGEMAPEAAADHTAGDFVAAFESAAARNLAAYSADGVLERTLTTPIGPMPGGAFLGLAITDTFVHTWDLAKATGQSTDLAPELAAVLLEQARASIQDSFRGPEGAPFGPEQTAPEGASNADRLAAFLGRTV